MAFGIDITVRCEKCKGYIHGNMTVYHGAFEYHIEPHECEPEDAAAKPPEGPTVRVKAEVDLDVTYDPGEAPEPESGTVGVPLAVLGATVVDPDLDTMAAIVIERLDEIRREANVEKALEAKAAAEIEAERKLETEGLRGPT